MVEIPDALRSLFSATLRERDGSYVVDVPASEVDTESLTVGETYRVAILQSEPTDSSTQDSQQDGSRVADRSSHPTPPVEEGEVRTVSVESVGDQGDGIAKVDRGYVVIVPGADPGDEPTVEIDEVKQNVAFATIDDATSRSL